MESFVRSYASQHRNVKQSHNVTYYFSPEKLPVLTTLAKSFAVFNGWFFSVPGPAVCNHAFAHYGTSFGWLGANSLIAGSVFGALTFLFFASLVIASMLGKSIPPESRLLVVAVLAIGIALGAGFLGGTASASGKIPFPSDLRPFSFSVAGGIAVFIIVFLIGYWTYIKTADVSVKLTGTVTDADANGGIPGATVVIKTEDRTYEKQTSDTGDFYVWGARKATEERDKYLYFQRKC